MGKAEKIKEQRKQDKVEKQTRKKRIIKNLTILGLVGILSVGLAIAGSYAYQKFTNKTKTIKSYKTGDKMYSQAPEMQIDVNKTYTAVMETDQGTMKIALNAKEAPKTVNNFVALSRDGFYDGLTFHRIIKTFMIQGGDPEGTGGGGPGYTIPAEISLEHIRGAIATARMSDQANPKKDSSGSQFFIDTQDQPSLDQGGYTVFGQVIEGMDVLDKLASVPVTENNGEPSKPINPPKIIKVTIEEK